MEPLSIQFEQHDKKDEERFDELRGLMKEHIKHCNNVLCELRPLRETVSWINSTGKFVVWFKPVFLALVSIAGAWVVFKGWFN